MLKMKEPPGMCMKTQAARQFARLKTRHFCLVACQFAEKRTDFAGTDSSFSLFEELGSDPSLLNVEIPGPNIVRPYRGTA
jgi:hypothetical protein